MANIFAALNSAKQNNANPETFDSSHKTITISYEQSKILKEILISKSKEISKKIDEIDENSKEFQAACSEYNSIDNLIKIICMKL